VQLHKGAVAGLGCALLAACSAPVEQKAGDTLAVPVAPAAESPAPAPAPSESYLGVVLATEAVELSAPFDGQLARLGVQPGDRARAGAVLGSMALEPLRSEEQMEQALLEQAEAELQRAELEVGEASERLQRYQQSPPGALSGDELSTARYQEKRAHAQVAAARARVRERRAALLGTRQRLVEAELRAPFDCVVAMRYLDPGVRLQAGMPVLRLIQAGTFRVRFALPEARSALLPAGQPVTLFLPALGKALPGRLESLSPEVDASSRMVFATATLLTPNEAVRAGMVARVSLDAGGPPGKSSGE